MSWNPREDRQLPLSGRWLAANQEFPVGHGESSQNGPFLAPPAFYGAVPNPSVNGEISQNLQPDLGVAGRNVYSLQDHPEAYSLPFNPFNGRQSLDEGYADYDADHGTMPPPPKRKRKAPNRTKGGVTKADWETHRKEITHKYLSEEMALEQIMADMEKKHNFVATHVTPLSSR
jgi:hypothetical protein